jgi:hypothetical protein
MNLTLQVVAAVVAAVAADCADVCGEGEGSMSSEIRLG